MRTPSVLPHKVRCVSDAPGESRSGVRCPAFRRSFPEGIPAESRYTEPAGRTARGPLSRQVTLLLGILALALPLALRAESTITGMLTDNWDARVPLGEAVTFRLDDLQFTADLPVGEWCAPTESPWSFQWKIDTGEWGPPNDPLYTPATNLLPVVGPHTVACRVVYHYYVKWQEDGAEHSAGPYDSQPQVFTDEIRVYGVDSILYSLDNGQTWEPTPTPLIVGKDEVIRFRAVPLGGPLFPEQRPLWSADTVPVGDGETAAVQFDTRAATAGDVRTVVAACGTSWQAVQVLVVEIERLQWRFSDEAGFVDFGDTPEVVPAYSQLVYRAIVAPAGVNLPPGRPVWTNATPDPQDPLQATATMPLAQTPDDFYRVEVLP